MAPAQTPSEYLEEVGQRIRLAQELVDVQVAAAQHRQAVNYDQVYRNQSMLKASWYICTRQLYLKECLQSYIDLFQAPTGLCEYLITRQLRFR